MLRPFLLPASFRSRGRSASLTGTGGHRRRAPLSSSRFFLIVRNGMNMQDKPQEPEGGPRVDEGMIFNRMLKSRTILVSGEINKPLAERVIRYLILLEEESADPIKVYID